MLAMATDVSLLKGTKNFLNRGKKNSPPLTSKQWKDAFDAETGCLLNGHKILQRVRRGGVEASIRSEVWPFLLNFYGLESTRKEREAERLMRRQAYENLKWRCKAVRESILMRPEFIPDNEDIFRDVGCLQMFCSENAVVHKGMEKCKSMASENSNPELIKLDAKAKQDFVNWQRIMRLDAVRINTDWTVFPPSQANITRVVANQRALEVGLRDDMLEPYLQHHAARLVSILEVYAVYDPEIGYCQGMSDLLSPLVAHLDEDYEAFWCFASFMHVARHNFRMDEEGIKRQLRTVSQIVKHSDLQLYEHLEKIQAADCYFIYRMVVVLMRRELSYEQTLSFWETLWADRTAMRFDKVKVSCRRVCGNVPPPTDDLLLYVIAAAIRQKRRVIMDNCICMEEVLEECNGMSGNLNIWVLLSDARNLIACTHHKVSADASKGILFREEES